MRTADLHQSSSSSSQPHENALADFVRSAVYAGVEEPMCGLAQIADGVSAKSHLQDSIKNGFKEIGIDKPAQATFGSIDWHMQQLGGAVGMVLPYLALGRVVNAGAAKVLGESAAYAGTVDLKLMSGSSVLGLAGKETLLSALTGFGYDSLFKPADTSTGGNIIAERLKNGISGAATFGVLGATNVMLGGAAAAIERSSAGSLLNNKFVLGILRNPISAGALSAIPAGLVSSEIEAQRDGQSLTLADRLKSIYAMGFVGAALGGANVLTSQHEGTARTNLDNAIDRVRGQNKVNQEQVTFKVVGANSENALEAFRKQTSSESQQSASAQIDVRQYLGRGLFGGGLLTGEGVLGRLGIWGDKYGQTRSLLVKHDLGRPETATIGNAGLLATCNPENLDAAIAARHIFAQGTGSVWLNGDRENRIVFNLGERPLAPETGANEEMPAIRLGRRANLGNVRYTTDDLAEAKAEHERWEEAWSNYTGNNPNKFRSERQRASMKLREIENYLKQTEQTLRTPQEELDAKLDGLFPNAESKQIVELDGTRYQRRFYPLEQSRSGQTVFDWGKTWVPLKD